MAAFMRNNMPRLHYQEVNTLSLCFKCGGLKTHSAPTREIEAHPNM